MSFFFLLSCLVIFLNKAHMAETGESDPGRNTTSLLFLLSGVTGLKQEVSSASHTHPCTFLDECI